VIARIAAATFLLVGAGIHLDLWQGGYRGVEYIGPMFLANVVLSGLLVLAVLFRPGTRVALAGIVFSVGSLVALVMSRTTGLLGFTERIWTDMAVQTITAELGAVVALTFVAVARRQAMPQPATVRTGR
jgi:hypothetical protein